MFKQKQSYFFLKLNAIIKCACVYIIFLLSEFFNNLFFLLSRVRSIIYSQSRLKRYNTIYTREIKLNQTRIVSKYHPLQLFTNVFLNCTCVHSCAYTYRKNNILYINVHFFLLIKK